MEYYKYKSMNQSTNELCMNDVMVDVTLQTLLLEIEAKTRQVQISVDLEWQNLFLKQNN